MCVCVCVLFSPPPLVFLGGSHGLRPVEPTKGTGEETPCVEVETVGPLGLVGRLAHGANRPSPSSGGLSWAALSDPCRSWPVLSGLSWVLGLHLVHLILNR